MAVNMSINTPLLISTSNLILTFSERNALIGFLVGALVLGIAVVVLELMNDTLRTESDIEKYLGIPTLANVPNKLSAQKREKYLPGKKYEKGRTK